MDCMGIPYRATGGIWVSPVGVALCHMRKGENRAADFFARLNHLENLGLIEWVPYLFESDRPEAERLHPYGYVGGVEGPESSLLDAAHKAGVLSLLTEGQRDWVAENNYVVAPVLRHIANVQLIGIARLRYRPKTSLTAAWWADLQERSEELVKIYSEIADKAREDARTAASAGYDPVEVRIARRHNHRCPQLSNR